MSQQLIMAPPATDDVDQSDDENLRKGKNGVVG
jgi:hypothetical protein